MTEKKPLNIVFDPGCFDNFEGTQAELDEFVAQIQAKAPSGSLSENAAQMTYQQL